MLDPDPTNRDSSLITTWILSPTASGTATDLRLSTIWEGHGGIGGFFERTFAPGAAAHPRGAARPPDQAARGRTGGLNGR
jgi:hypothetical protein